VDVFTTEIFSVEFTADNMAGYTGYAPQHPPCPRMVFPLARVLGKDLDNEV
jgi:hypothetical protein